MRRIAKESTQNSVIKICYLYEDEALEAAQNEPEFDHLEKTAIDRSDFDAFEADVPDFSGETAAYISCDKHGRDLGIFGFWDVRQECED